MILILAYWIFLFATFLPLGILVKKIFKLNISNIAVLLLFGMFFATLYFTIAAFFFPLGFYTFAVLFAGSISILYRFRNQAFLSFKSFIQALKASNAYIISFFLLLFLFAMFESSQVSNLTDNDTYYIQTIKWLNQYGFVKGLGNLHLFFAQTSGWHVLQAGLDLSFMTNRINDLNGFLFIICIFYYLIESYTYRKAKGKVHWIAIMPFFSLLTLMLVDSPSPDLPLLMVIPILFHLFLEDDSKMNYRTYFLLFVFLVFIKITIAPMAVLLLFGFSLKTHRNLIVTALCIATLWITKNIIISGYPFYPFPVMAGGFDWTIPEQLISGVNNRSNEFVYGISNSASFIQKIWSWFTIGGFDGILNKLIVSLFIIMPFFNKFRSNRKLMIIYGIMFLHFTILLLTSPQPRFFLPEILFFTAIILANIINSLRKTHLLYKTGIAITIIAIVLNFSFQNQYPFYANSFKFITQPLLLPEPNSGLYSMSCNKVTIENLSFNSPAQHYLLYVTGDCPLPCVNEAQIRLFRQKYNIIPQLRGKTLSDGFYSQEVNAKNFNLK